MSDTVRITGYSSRGEGVGRTQDGRVAFVRGAARGDICEIEIIDERQRSCRARIVNIIEPSEYRIDPDCPAYPMCGGCDFRHISYEEELQAKLDRVNDALRRIGATDKKASQILSTGQTDGYRNKAVFHTEQREGKEVIGFFRAGTHEVYPVEKCLLLKDEINAKLGKLHSDPGPKDKAITLRAGTDGHTPVREELDGLVFQVSGAAFFQVNSDAALLLFRKARRYAALSKDSVLADLYCGVGPLTLFIGRDAGYAVGVENDPVAVEDARTNAKLNGLDHVDFVLADSGVWEAGRSFRPDCVTVDPPRKGLSTAAVDKILALSPARIIYISCDPATFARDIKRLKGYEVQKLCAVDMFPRTANVECCALLHA